MTTMNLRTREENGSLIITCNSYTDRNALRRFLTSKIENIDEIFDDVFVFSFKREFEIIVNDYEGIKLMVLQNESSEYEYYLFDDQVRCLKVYGTSIIFKSSDIIITNDSLDNESNTRLLINFINYLGELKEVIPFNFEPNLLCTSLRIFNDKYSKIIIEDDDIILTLPNFYRETLHKLSLNIVSKKDLKVIGSIDCLFNDIGLDNFNYRGNVTINMYSEDNNEYGIKALRLFKTYVGLSEEEVNKDIFIACKQEDKDTLEIVVSGGGTLYYDGEVPKSDPLNFIGKVKSVKVYRIGVNNE